MPSNSQIENTLSKTLTDLIKADITRKDLIDTGAMLRSIDADVQISNKGELTIDVIAVDYFIYVSGNYSIMDDVLETRQWADALEEAVYQMIENKFK